jgi:hypothetical protein
VRYDTDMRASTLTGGGDGAKDGATRLTAAMHQAVLVCPVAHTEAMIMLGAA